MEKLEKLKQLEFLSKSIGKTFKFLLILLFICLGIIVSVERITKEINAKELGSTVFNNYQDLKDRLDSTPNYDNQQILLRAYTEQLAYEKKFNRKLTKDDDNPFNSSSLSYGTIVIMIVIVCIMVFAGVKLTILLFRPIIKFSEYRASYMSGILTINEFKRKRRLSLICSLTFGLLFIVATFGISFISMIPHYILLIKSSPNN